MYGTSLRGSRTAVRTAIDLLAAVVHGEKTVIAQRQVDSKSNEITALQPLLAPLRLTGIVVTFDALLTQTDQAPCLVEEKRAHYIAVVKGNHPALRKSLKKLPWQDVPLLDKTRAAGHGRDEIRRLKAATATGLAFPQAVQALQIVHRRRDVRREGKHRVRLRGHQPAGRAGHRGPTRRHRPRALAGRGEEGHRYRGAPEGVARKRRALALARPAGKEDAGDFDALLDEKNYRR